MLTLERTKGPLKQVCESNFKQMILEDLKIVKIFQDSYFFCQRKDLEKIQTLSVGLFTRLVFPLYPLILHLIRSRKSTHTGF